MEILNILPNSFEPKATENLDAMKEMIENLLSKDIAYKTDDSVYFDVSKIKIMVHYQIKQVMKFTSKS